MAAYTTPSHEAARHTPAARSIREVVFGVNDGLVSITGLVVGVAASHMAAHQVLIAGLAATTAATVAMGLGAYLSTSAQNEYFLAERDREYREVEEIPLEEQQEVEAIFRRQGFAPDLVALLTRHTIADRERWVDFMMKEELGIMLDSLDNPWTSALIMASAVIIGSLPPIVPFVFFGRVSTALPWAITLALLTAFGLGVVKARVARANRWKSGLQFVVATTVAVLVGLGAGDLFNLL